MAGFKAPSNVSCTIQLQSRELSPQCVAVPFGWSFFRSFHSDQYPMNNNVSLNVSFSDSPDSSPILYEGKTGGVR